MFVMMEFVQESKNKITKDKSGLTHIQLRSGKKQCITDNEYHYGIITYYTLFFMRTWKTVQYIQVSLLMGYHCIYNYPKKFLYLTMFRCLEKKLPYAYTCETSTRFAPLLVLFIFSFFYSLTFLLYRSEVTKELSCWRKDQ